MQNKPNPQNQEINLTPYSKKNYARTSTLRPRKNKPKTNPIQPNPIVRIRETNPIQPQYAIHCTLPAAQLPPPSLSPKSAEISLEAPKSGAKKSKNHNSFAQNKPNRQNTKTNLTTVATKPYEGKPPRRPRKNKPNSNPIQANHTPGIEKTNAIQTQPNSIPASPKRPTLPKLTQPNPNPKVLPPILNTLSALRSALPNNHLSPCALHFLPLHITLLKSGVPKMKQALQLSLILLLVFGSASKGQAKVDFSKLQTPIIFRGDQKYAYRDPAVVYHEGKFHLYFTLSETASDDGYYNMTAYSTSDDLLHWTFPKPITPKDRNLNHSSPGNIIRYAGKWIICLQTYPTPNRETFGTPESRIWIMRSTDLADWSEPELLKVKGNDVPVEEMGRMIDPYLLEDFDEKGKWWCFYKQRGVSMSYSHDLKSWTYVGHAQAGENVTVIRQGGEYVMFHSPGNGIGVKRSKDPKSWGPDVQLITLAQKQWPWSQGRLTAATVIDLTKEPAVGKYVMFFHGSSKEGLKRHRAHGQASLAIAWSDDLKKWNWP